MTTIEALRAGAAAAGDLAMVAICDRALAGSRRAIAECGRVMADARAMEDDGLDIYRERLGDDLRWTGER